MTPEEIRRAFDPFLAELRGGGFTAPEQGWPAEWVAAHVILNNDAFADAARAVKAGLEVTYDNASTVDLEELRQCAASIGSLEALAEAVEASAYRLTAALAALDPEQARTVIEVQIRDEGPEIRGTPGTIEQMILDSATSHLRMHTDQLRALRTA
jgi:hypothetical protein